MLTRTLLGAVIATAVLSAGGVASADDGERAAFVNIAAEGGVAQATIASLRAELRGGDWVFPNRPALRDALEQAESGAGTLEREAVTLLDIARADYSKFESGAALTRIAEARTRLLAAPPSRSVAASLAESYLLEGLILLDDKRQRRALEAFSAVHRLAPEPVVLDRGEYRPEVVATFAAAAEADEPVPVLLVTSEPATLSVDGRVVGPAPQQLKLAPGVHYVSAEGPAVVATARLIEVDRSGEEFLLEARPARVEDRIRALRARWIGARGDASVDELARELSRLSAARLVVLVRDRDGGGLEAALWTATGGLGGWIPVPSTRFHAAMTAGEHSPAQLTGDDRRNADRPWYRRWWGVGLIATGSAAIVAGIVYAIAAR